VILPVLLAFGVIGWEQLLHTTTGRSAFLLYEILHWVSDSLLALPLACLAVWCGERLARQQRLDSRSVSGLLGCAALISLAYAVVLVPGAAIHEWADGLTHAHAVIAVHSHVAAQPIDAQEPGAVLTFVLHAFSDGVLGQLIGLPLAFSCLLWAARGRWAGGLARRLNLFQGSHSS
jgi:hypothetical protein